MKIKNILKSLILIVTLNFTASSCADWLKVDMEDGIMEDKLFSETRVSLQYSTVHTAA